jgi:membrane-associated phospholipid phosphatase
MFKTLRAARGVFAGCMTLALLGMPALPIVASGQIVLSKPDSALPQKHKHLFNHRDAVIAAGMAVTMFALFPVDKRLAAELRDSATQANRFFSHASKGVELIASPGAYFIGGGLFVLGRFGNMPRVADLGWHGTEAVLIGEGIGYVLKGTMGRSRPFVSDGKISEDFDLGRGFKDPAWRSFPSGHSTTAFAAAAAVTDEATIWWPRSTWLIGPAMYGGATLVGLSRMYHNKHWASDVALGALIGTFSGKKVVLASHDNPNNFLDRILLGTHVASGPNATLKVGWVIQTDGAHTLGDWNR